MNLEEFKARVKQEQEKKKVPIEVIEAVLENYIKTKQEGKERKLPNITSVYGAPIKVSNYPKEACAYDEDYERDLERDFLISLSLLSTAAKMLGFYGNKKKASAKGRHITKTDIFQMNRAAEEIETFLDVQGDWESLVAEGVIKP